MFQLQFFNCEFNQMQTLKFKIIDNAGCGDCLFSTLLLFLKSNKLVEKICQEDLRKMIVEKATSEFDFLKLQEIKFNLENHVEFFSTLNLDSIQSNIDLQNECSREYYNYMSLPGHYGTLFELEFATKLFGFVALVFMKQGDMVFKCFDIGTSDDKNIPKLFILFTGPTHNGHFRLLKPSSIECVCVQSAEYIPRGDYSIFKEDLSSFYLKKGLPQSKDKS